MMLVSGSGKFITQRQFPQLAKVRVQILEYKIIFQSVDSPTDLSLDLKFLDDALIEVEIWGDRHKAIDLGEVAAQWFHQLLNLSPDRICRLVKESPNHVRLLDKKYPQDRERPLGFADNPVMLTATASLSELNQRIVEIHQQQSQAIPMNRFRPNIVIETREPFIEDSWSLIQIGDIQFKMAKPCSRCIITTVDRDRGAKNQLKESLNTLGTFRQLSEQGVMFGVNMIPLNEGMISRGDRLQVLKTRG